MTTCRGSSISFAVAALLACSAKGAMQFELKPSTVRPGERAILEIRLPESDLTRPENSDPEEAPQALDELFLQSNQFLVLDRDYRKEDDVYVWRYDVTAYKAGRYSLPPIQIKLGPQTFSTEATPLVVDETRPQGDNELRPEFGPISAPFPWLRMILAMLAIASAGAAVWFLRRRKPAPAAAPPPPVIPWESDMDWLRRKLRALKARLQNGSENEDLVDDLTEMLRGYFSRRNKLPVTAWTTTEIKQSLGNDAKVSGFAPLFDKCDRFKFTGSREPKPQQLAAEGVEQSERTLLDGKAALKPVWEGKS